MEYVFLVFVFFSCLVGFHWYSLLFIDLLGKVAVYEDNLDGVWPMDSYAGGSISWESSDGKFFPS